jgi:hypothetical protein
MKMGRWAGLVGLVVIPLACESSSSPSNMGAAGTANEPTECREGDFDFCDEPPGCGLSTRTCEAGSPNKFSACVCEAVAVSDVGPLYSYADKIEAMAYGEDAFYWSEYFFVIGKPYSRLIVSKPFGSKGELLIDDIKGGVERLAVQGDRILVNNDVYSTSGDFIESLKPAGTPDVAQGGESGLGGAGPDGSSAGGAPADATGAGGASSAEPSRITYTDDGLLLDGTKITPRVWFYQATDTGVYYVPYNDTGNIEYVSFDDPENPNLVASSDFSGAFESFDIKDDELYAVILDEDRVTRRVVYGSLSVLGK